MNKTLWVFGDSFSAPFAKNQASAYNEYIEYLGYRPKNYGEIVSEELNLRYINRAKGGYDNYSILQTICKSSDEIKDGDIIIINWTHTDRFRIVMPEENQWISLTPHLINHHFEKGIKFDLDYNELLNMAHHRCHTKFQEEVKDWITLLNNTFKNNSVIHWTWVCDADFGAKVIANYPTINSDTNGEIKDFHYSEKGHEYLAKTFLKILNKVPIKDII